MKNLTTLRLVIFCGFLLTIVACDDSEDPRYVPGEDITTLLQEDLDNGNDITLPAGKFYVGGTLYNEGYCGTIRGDSQGTTEIIAAQNFKSLDAGFLGYDFEWASFFLLNSPTCDIVISDLTFLIEGEEPAEAHETQWGVIRSAMDNAISVLGSTEVSINVTIRNLQVIGQETSLETTWGKNLGSAFFVKGNDNSSAGIKAINLLVEDTKIENAGIVGIQYSQAGGGFGVIQNNHFLNGQGAIYIGLGMTGLNVDVKDNEFWNIADYILQNDYAANCCFMGNTLDGVAMADDCN